MNIWILVGIIGITFTSLQLIPQVYKSLKTKSVRDLSLGLSIIVGLGSITWIIYAWHLNDIPIFIANLINLIAALILFSLKIREIKSEK